MNEKFRSVISHSQDDKVKVVYSWYGPRGPIWNTELPNILTMAGEAHGINPIMESRHFWSDDVWNKQFSKAKDKFELTPCQGIEADAMTPFIYPFSMTWRLNFGSYFITDSGILEFSHMPQWLIHMCQVRNGYILIDHSVEAFMGDAELQAMFSYFHKNHKIPMYKIIYLTGTVNASVVYEKFCEQHQIPNDRKHRMHIIPYASSREIFHNFYHSQTYSTDEGDLPITESVYNCETVPDKLFLTWNRRFRKHRTSLALLLEKNNLIEKSLISFAKVDSEQALRTVTEEIENQRDDDGELRLYESQHLHIAPEIADRFVNRCPLIIDGETNINKMCEDFGYTQSYYQQTLLSLITETNYNNDECTLTEKSFKPLYNKHPFIIIGVPGSMQGLRDLGFQTFSEFWSEEYDTIESPSNRLIAIEQVLKQIASWTRDDILYFKRRVKPILEHNYNMFKEPGSVTVVNNIYEHITNNFNTDYSEYCDLERRCSFE